MSTSAPSSRRPHAPGWIWPLLRLQALFAVAAIVVLLFILFIRPQAGLTIFWCVVVPVLPLWFLVAPGLWRNICPLATLNQAPRRFAWGRPRPLPTTLRRAAPLVGFAPFMCLVAGRKVLFNTDARALAALILILATLALLGGLRFTGKSGWCSSICPLLPVQRLYGQTAFVPVAHRHCQPCVGCIRRCHDLRPSLAVVLDSARDGGPPARAYGLIVGAFPGFVVAFYIVPSPPTLPVWQIMALFLPFMVASGVIFWAIRSLLHMQGTAAARLYAALAFALYYWLTAGNVANQLNRTWGWTVPPTAVWAIRLFALSLGAVWLWRSLRTTAIRQAVPATVTGSRGSPVTPFANAAMSYGEGGSLAARSRHPATEEQPAFRLATVEAGRPPGSRPPPAA